MSLRDILFLLEGWSFVDAAGSRVFGGPQPKIFFSCRRSSSSRVSIASIYMFPSDGARTSIHSFEVVAVGGVYFSKAAVDPIGGAPILLEALRRIYRPVHGVVNTLPLLLFLEDCLLLVEGVEVSLRTSSYRSIF